MKAVIENIEDTIRQVWEKASICAQESKDEWRKDSCNELIRWKDYRNIHSEFGWVINVIKPEEGGEIKNLRPLQWKNEFKILLNRHTINTRI